MCYIVIDEVFVRFIRLISFIKTNRDYFRRAFAAATVHDAFNLLSVLVLLPVEIASGYLEIVTGAFVNATIETGTNNTIAKVEILSVITKPVAELIVRLDSKTLDAYAIDPEAAARKNLTLIKKICTSGNKTSKCSFLFNNDWAEWVNGLVIFFISLFFLIACLVCLVKILSSLFKGPTGKLLTKWVNADLPGCFKFLTGYLAILVSGLRKN